MTLLAVNGDLVEAGRGGSGRSCSAGEQQPRLWLTQESGADLVVGSGVNRCPGKRDRAVEDRPVGGW